MEQNLFEPKSHEYKFHFPLQYKNENFYKNPAFKEWYNIKKKYVEEENKIRGPWNEENYQKYGFDERYYIFSYCPNCISCAICLVKNEYSFVQCKNCGEEFCIGCYRNKIYRYEDTICLKGFLKLLYYRVIGKRSSNSTYKPLLYFFHIIVCLFITPIYLGTISHYLGFIVHRKKKGSFFDDALISGLPFRFSFFFSFFRGLLMFPYIITFFPFMLILLLPGIFSYNYYIYIYNTYITIFMPGNTQ